MSSEAYNVTHKHPPMGFFVLPESVMDARFKQDEFGTWQNVKCITKSLCEDISSVEGCNDCHVFLRRSSTGGLEMEVDRINAFMGFDTQLCCQSCGQTRSDASLLLGVLLACNEFVSIEKLLVTGQLNGSSTMVVTVSFPYLMMGAPGQRSISTANRGKSNKPLPSALQLVLSIVRSDWWNLELLMKQLTLDSKSPTKVGSTTRRHVTLFPSKLLLEELYKRIPGSSGAVQDFNDRPDKETVQSSDCFLALIPQELLVERVAPFLKARSLDSLRCTSKRFHKALKGVVPGLKLRLFRHQIASLSWMRERECKGLWESDCLCDTMQSIAGVHDSDAHRAATGGMTTLLRVQPTDDNDALGTSVRVYQYSGREVTVNELASLPRSIARGGKLCVHPKYDASVNET
jgi:hypothetical protein